MKEIWKETYFSKNYEVSNLGRIGSKDRLIISERPKYRDVICFQRSGKIISQQIDVNGYNVLNKKAYRQKKVMCVETGEIFDSCKKASKKIGRYNSSVSDAIRLGYKSGGLTWIEIKF